MNDIDIKNWVRNINNLEDYSKRVSPNYNRNKDINSIMDTLNKTNWKNESDYYNSYHGKNNANTIRLKKK